MPISSPAGNLVTLLDLVDLTRQHDVETVAAQWTTSVLMVDAPAEAWAENTAVQTGGGAEKEGRAMLPTLVVKVTPGKVSQNPDKLTVGRSSACDIVLPFSGLSKIHAAITIVPNSGTLIEDIGSTNGTNVEGTRLAKGARATLVDGTRVRFGDVHATFYGPRAFALMLRHKSR